MVEEIMTLQFVAFRLKALNTEGRTLSAQAPTYLFYIMKFLYLLLLMSLSFTVQSQNIKTSTITWKSTSLLNLTSGELTEGANTLTSQGTTGITWTIADGTFVVFTVSEVMGQWNDVAKNGEVVYEVTSDTWRGTITFIKADSGHKIRMILLGGESEPSIQELTVSSFQVQ